MLRMQTVFAECPSKSKLKYSLRISLLDWSPEDYHVLLQQPGSQAVESEVAEESITVERSDGPGVWRFNAVVRSKEKPDNVADALTVEAVIFPETQKAAQAAVESCISGMDLVVTGDGSVASGNTDVSADAGKLYYGFGDTATLEILRRLSLNRRDQNDTLRCLHLLECTLNRSSAKWLTPFALPVITEIASATNNTFVTSTAFSLIKNMFAPTNEKWIYLMRYALEVPRVNLDNIIYELGTCAPVEYRSQTAATIIELCSGRVNSRRAAANLCVMFEYAASAPIVMDWLQTNTCDLDTACKVFQMAAYREAIPFLRMQIAKPGNDSVVGKIMLLLAEWQDTDSLPLLLSKLPEMEYENPVKDITRQLVASFGLTVVPQIKEVQSRCNQEKAKWIGQVLEKMTVK